MASRYAAPSSTWALARSLLDVSRRSCGHAATPKRPYSYNNASDHTCRSLRWTRSVAFTGGNLGLGSLDWAKHAEQAAACDATQPYRDVYTSHGTCQQQSQTTEQATVHTHASPCTLGNACAMVLLSPLIHLWPQPSSVPVTARSAVPAPSTCSSNSTPRCWYWHAETIMRKPQQHAEAVLCAAALGMSSHS